MRQVQLVHKEIRVIKVQLAVPAQMVLLDSQVLLVQQVPKEMMVQQVQLVPPVQQVR